MQVKIRQVVPGSYKTKNGIVTREPVFAVTIPKSVIPFFPKGTLLTIERSGTSIVLTSGCEIIIKKEEVARYTFSDCEVK